MLVALAGGCVLYPPAETNDPPVILDADVVCTPFDDVDLWELAALVDDERGPLEVVSVEAWIWDLASGEDLLYLPLFPTIDAFVWAAAYEVSDEPAVCGDALGVDLVAWDSWGAWTVQTLSMGETL
jgi:hypothetical protein